MDFWMQSLAVFRAATVLSSDWPGESVDTVFLFSSARGGSGELIELAADFCRRGVARCVVINGSMGEDRPTKTPYKAWEGADVWAAELSARGAVVFCSRPAFDTKHENELFLELAMGRGWRSAAILPQPYHLLRAFLGMVKSMADHDYWMRIYATAPKSTDWWKEVFGSQGAECLPRFSHIEREFKRIFLYQRTGEYGKNGRDLAYFEELFEYLKRRESIR